MTQVQKRDLLKSMMNFKRFYFQCFKVLVMYSELAIFIVMYSEIATN